MPKNYADHLYAGTGGLPAIKLIGIQGKEFSIENISPSTLGSRRKNSAKYTKQTNFPEGPFQLIFSKSNESSVRKSSITDIEIAAYHMHDNHNKSITFVAKESASLDGNAPEGIKKVLNMENIKKFADCISLSDDEPMNDDEPIFNDKILDMKKIKEFADCISLSDDESTSFFKKDKIQEEGIDDFLFFLNSFKKSSNDNSTLHQNIRGKRKRNGDDNKDKCKDKKLRLG